jgi:prepilin-type N-terminal cleavage/methylation domain-containing protein
MMKSKFSMPQVARRPSLSERTGVKAAASRAADCGLRATDCTAFTLIELILVMAILTIAVSLTAPTLGHFFSGRALDSEARRLLSVIRAGQSRAVSEGMPMELWIDAPQRRYVLEAETSSKTGDSDVDEKRIELSLDRDVQLEVASQTITKPAATTRSPMVAVSIASVLPVNLKQPGLPTMRFLPDGSFGENTPQSLRLTDRDGASLWVTLSRNRMNYEIRSEPN